MGTDVQPSASPLCLRSQQASRPSSSASGRRARPVAGGGQGQPAFPSYTAQPPARPRPRVLPGNEGPSVLVPLCPFIRPSARWPSAHADQRDCPGWAGAENALCPECAGRLPGGQGPADSHHRPLPAPLPSSALGWGSPRGAETPHSRGLQSIPSGWEAAELAHPCTAPPARPPRALLSVLRPATPQLVLHPIALR